MIIVEHRHTNKQHNQINACMLYMICQKYFDRNIHFFSEKQHYSNIKEILKVYLPNEKKIQFHKINPPNPFALEYTRFAKDYELFKNIFNFAYENNIKQILSLSTSVSSLICLKILSRRYPDIKIKTILHSDLERITLKNIVRDFKLGRFLYMSFVNLRLPMLLFNTNNLKYLVLGESIKSNLLKNLPALTKYAESIDHPYFYKPVKRDTCHISAIFPLLGSFGSIHETKGGGLLLKLLAKLNDKYKNQTQFIICGNIQSNKINEKVKHYEFVKTLNNGSNFISADEYDKQAQLMDYCIFFYDKESYKLGASGAFWDAISYVKPIIALKNDYFEYYFKKFGNIGYLFDSYEELESKVISILSNPQQEQYNEQVQNLINARKLLNTNKIAENLILD